MGKYELVLRSGFSATHRLRLGGGEPEPMHRHAWRVELFMEGRDLNAADLLVDFTVLQRNLRQITTELHEKCLNELPVFSARNPSAELVARHLHDRYSPTLPPGVRLVKARVWETDDCAAAYVPPDIQAEQSIGPDAKGHG
jgi:6-pyruvoyl-tetrahydropterin synthase